MPKVGKVGKRHRRKRPRSGTRKTEGQLRAERERRRHGKVTVRHADGTVEVRKAGSFQKQRDDTARVAKGKKTRKPWKERYRDHLRSPQWSALRQRVLQRDRFSCVHCGEQEAVLHVHHLTYKRFGQERLDDLATLCVLCHRRAHGQAVPDLSLYELALRAKDQDHRESANTQPADVVDRQWPAQNPPESLPDTSG